MAEGFDIASIGTGAAAGVVNNVMDLAFGGLKQKRQLKGQKIALEQQNAANYDMWLKTNYGAQVEQLEKAGLNPGLIYGMGGGGGGTIGNASAMPSPQEGKGMDIHGAAQLALLKAQEENIRASTNKMNIEAQKAAGVETEALKAGIVKTLQDAATAKSSEDLNKAIEKGKTIENLFNQEANPRLIRRLDLENEELIEDVEKLKIQNKIQRGTADELIAQAKLGTAGKKIENELNQAKIKLTNAQEQEALASIQQKWKDLDIKTRSVTVAEKHLQMQKFVEGVKLEYPSLWNVIGKTISDIFEDANKAGKRTFGGPSEMPK